MRRPLAKASCRSRSARGIALLLAWMLVLALGAAQAQAAPKGVLGFVGGPSGTGAGQFNTPRGVAVNQTNGELYVVDSSNHRIQRFGAAGFVSAWGVDVVRPGGPGNVPVNEQQTVTVVATGGTFTLTFTGQTTAAIAFDATAASVQAALESLSNLEPGDVVVSGDAGGPWTVDFAGTRADTDVAQMTGNATNLTGTPKSVTVATRINGASAFEICTMAMSCKQGSASLPLDGPGGELSSPQGAVVDEFDGSVYVTNQGNRRVDKFDAAGNFVFAFGWDVSAAGGSGLETCTTDCQQGDAGAGAGQFGAAIGQLTLDPRNRNVVVADPSNRRVQRFDFLGGFVDAFGAPGSGPGQFATSQPTRVAVDSTGNVYTVESSGNFRVQKFNPSGTIGGVFAAAQASGTNSDTTPSDVAVDLANDNVLVAKGDTSSGATERRVLEFNFGGSLVDTHGAGAGLPAANGMALHRSSGRIYVATSANTATHRLAVLGPITPPSVTIGAVSSVMPRSATFNGTVNPNGGELPTFYRFEFSDDGGTTWSRVPATDVNIGSTPGDQNVSQPVTGLEPNTEYQVRLVASRQFAGGSATSAVEPFTTVAIPPSISGVGAREIAATQAVLGGHIDPNASPTTYRFEYGTDTGYGTATAVEDAGSGSTNVSVSKTVPGLQPNTTYHFRLLATNAAGESEGADQTFTTAAGAVPPSGRAYEMVSPLDKNGGEVERDRLEVLSAQSGAAPSGEAVAYLSRVPFADIESGTLHPNYVARRGPGGWTTEGVSPPMGNPLVSATFPRLSGLSRDLSKAYVKTPALLTPDAEDLGGSWGLYARTSGQAERYRLLSSPWEPLGEVSGPTAAANSFEFVTDTADSRHAVFNSNRQLLEDAPSDGPGTQGSNAVYEWADGEVRLVSVPPGVSSFGTQVVGGARALRDGLPGDNLISDDGRRVFFTADGPGGGLLVREDGATTTLIAAGGAQFWAAKSTDGSVAFFRAVAPLTSGAGTNSLYSWDANDTDGQPLTELSRDLRAGQSAGVMGPAAVTDDATSVYLVASGVLAPGDPAADPPRVPTPGEPNLYLWRQGEPVRYIATLDDTLEQSTSVLDGPMWVPDWAGGGRGARVSADGERLLFASYADLDPAYDTTEATPEACGDAEESGDRCRQIYLYDARSGETSCLTCVAGVPVSADANLFGNGDFRRPDQTGGRLIDAPVRQPRNLSADGTRAFFETARPLVSADQNSRLDVYEWHDADLDGRGELRLMSPGRGATDSKFVDASVTGDDVFFTTREQLVGIDTDNQVDLYDARIGGGIPAQNPPPAFPCQGEECQGTPSGAPFLAGVGSGGVSHGDLRPGPRRAFSVARLSRAQLAKLARGGRVPVRVRVNRSGRVALTARAKLGRRVRVVDRASEAARRAGTVRLGLKLSRSARRELASDGRLVVRLAVRFAGVREARASTLRLRRAEASEERSAP